MYFSEFFEEFKRHTHDIMVLWNRTIIILNKYDHESRVLALVCIAYILIPMHRWYVKFDVNVFNNVDRNVAIYSSRLILLTHVANN